jgi:hypothetical protein
VAVDPKLEVPHDAVNVDADQVKEHLPEFEQLKASGHADVAAKLVHEESSQIAAQIATAAIRTKRNVIVDGVGDSGHGKFASKIAAAHNEGHAVTVRYAHLPVADAIDREELRANRTGRKVPRETLKTGHRNVATNYHNEVQHLNGIKTEVYDMAGAKSAPLPLIAERTTAGTLTVHDQARYDEFINKRNG